VAALKSPSTSSPTITSLVLAKPSGATSRTSTLGFEMPPRQRVVSVTCTTGIDPAIHTLGRL
jgi:hypothetical protein